VAVQERVSGVERSMGASPSKMHQRAHRGALAGIVGEL
jgi:hypothetical protein